MSVLELSEESKALRQAAKAWSHGEIPTSDYRMIRRATLEGMLGDAEDGADYDDEAENLTEPNADDTEVVDQEEVTQRAHPSQGLLIGLAVVIVIGAAILMALL